MPNTPTKTHIFRNDNNPQPKEQSNIRGPAVRSCAPVAVAVDVATLVRCVSWVDVDEVLVRLVRRRCRRTVTAVPTRALDTSQLMAPLTCCEPRLSSDAVLSTKDMMPMPAVGGLWGVWAVLFWYC